MVSRRLFQIVNSQHDQRDLDAHLSPERDSFALLGWPVPDFCAKVCGNQRDFAVGTCRDVCRHGSFSRGLIQEGLGVDQGVLGREKQPVVHRHVVGGRDV
jgi:hypothetical protein